MSGREIVRPHKFGEWARWWNSRTDAARQAINKGLIGKEDIFNAGWDAALARLQEFASMTDPTALEKAARERAIDAVEAKVGGAFSGVIGRILAAELVDAVLGAIASLPPRNFNDTNEVE